MPPKKGKGKLPIFFGNGERVNPIYGCKEVIYEPGESKQFYFDKIFVEISIGCAPECIKNLENNRQVQRKSYGLKHHISGTIHSDMGDTLAAVATSISLHDRNYTLWDKVQ